MEVSMKRTKRTDWLLLVTLFAAAILVAVGLVPGFARLNQNGAQAHLAQASPEASPPAVDGSPTAGDGQAVTITMIDINFDPKEVTIPANTDVTVNLPNNGVTAHNFQVDQLNVHTEDVAPGASATVTINAAAGDYEYYCAIPGHKQAGMVGTIHVQ
jgi:nitrite reductase (NO-forming)